MGLGDRVILQARVAFGGKEPALRGVVVAEAAGPPATSDVLWENGKRTDGIDNTLLFKFFLPGDLDPELLNIIGKRVQIDDYPALGSGLGPKSPAASGLVRGAFAYGDMDAVSPINGVVEVEVMGGKGVIPVTALPSPPGPVTVIGRRGNF